VRKVNRKSIYCLGAAAIALLVGGTAAASSAYKTVTLEVDGQKKEVDGFLFGTIGELLQREGIQVEKEDLVQPTGSIEITDGTAIVVTHAKTITVQDGASEPITVKTQSSTVSDLLKELNITLNESDKIDVALTTAVEDGKTLSIVRRHEDVKVAEEAIPFQTERQPDAEQFTGTEKVLTPGVEGKATIKTTIVLENGKEVDRKVQREVAQQPVNKVVTYGTKQRPIVVASRGGENVTASKTLSMNASAYSMPGNRTATGTAAGNGTIAVDPSVIPLGTKLFIEGYGYGVASDVGGAIKGNRIDLHFATTAQALQWGHRTVKVHILN